MDLTNMAFQSQMMVTQGNSESIEEEEQYDINEEQSDNQDLVANIADYFRRQDEMNNLSA